MTDVHDTETRSRNMAAVKSKDTKPEMIIRRLCHSMGFRYRLHRKDLPGKPDLVFPKYKAVMFVHGCFWHKHDCPKGATPATRIEFWEKKQKENAQRDKFSQRALITQGWKVIVIWECALVGTKKATTEKLHDWIFANLSQPEPKICELGSLD